VLNRDMRHVVLVDKDGAADWLPQPDNVIYVPPWEGDMNDTALLDLLPLLEALAMPDVPDVREVSRRRVLDAHRYSMMRTDLGTVTPNSGISARRRGCWTRSSRCTRRTGSGAGCLWPSLSASRSGVGASGRASISDSRPARSLGRAPASR
jgi:hypothetical protein